MNIYEEVNKILQEQNESATVLEIFKTGSQLFKSNPTDLDYVAICENYTKRRTRQYRIVEGESYDIIIIDKEAVQAQLDFDNETFIHKNHKLFNYFYPIRETVWGNYEIEWEMLDHKNEYLEFARKRYRESIGKLLKKTSSCFSKTYVHYYIILEMYRHLRIEVTKEMKRNIQLLYRGGREATSIIMYINQEMMT